MWRVQFELRTNNKIDSIQAKETKNKRLELDSKEYVDDDGITKRFSDFTFNNENDARKLYEAIKSLMSIEKPIGNITIHNCPHTEGEKDPTPCNVEKYSNE